MTKKRVSWKVFSGATRTGTVVLEPDDSEIVFVLPDTTADWTVIRWIPHLKDYRIVAPLAKERLQTIV